MLSSAATMPAFRSNRTWLWSFTTPSPKPAAKLRCAKIMSNTGGGWNSSLTKSKPSRRRKTKSSDMLVQLRDRISPATLRDSLIAVEGGQGTKAERLNRVRNLLQDRTQDEITILNAGVVALQINRARPGHVRP